MKMGYDILFECMKISDNIIALMPWLTLINSQKRTKKLLDFGIKNIIHLPRNAFPGSRVQTCIIIFEKNIKQDIIIKFIEKESDINYKIV